MFIKQASYRNLEDIPLPFRRSSPSFFAESKKPLKSEIPIDSTSRTSLPLENILFLLLLFLLLFNLNSSLISF